MAIINEGSNEPKMHPNEYNNRIEKENNRIVTYPD